MNNKILLKIAKVSGWLLLLTLIFYFISGYAMVHEYGFDRLMNRPSAWALHKYMTIPFLVLLVLHIVPYYVVRKQVKRLLVITFVMVFLSVSGAYAIDKVLQQTKNNSPARTEQKEIKEKTVTCPNCRNGCVLKPGEKGECGEFENIDGKIQPVQKTTK